MEFDSPRWLWLLPLFAAPGLWLTVRLYGRPRRLGLAFAYALAWILIGVLAVSPRWRFRSETWHAPLVVLAVDQSGSYAALGSQAIARASVRAARAHYEALGFTVRETAYPLGRDVASFPNLQAVLAWTDGRDSSERRELPAPTPLFPVVVVPTQSEVQGELVVADSTMLTVEWRVLGGRGKTGALSPSAELVLVEGGAILWRTTLVPPAEAPIGERVTLQLTLPATLRARAAQADPASWRALVRPEQGNRFTENDTLALMVRGRNNPRRILIRPLATLEERGLADALRSSIVTEISSGAAEEALPAGDPVVTALEVSALSGWLATASEARGAGAWRTVIWVRAGSSTLAAVWAAAKPAGVPVIVYVPSDLANASNAANAQRGGFSADARVVWRTEGAPFLPAGVLRLGDLGFGDARFAQNLHAPDPLLEALAYAEEDGRRGLLFWREKDNGVFGCALPPLWNTTFSSNFSKGSGQATPWLQGISEWARRASEGTGAAQPSAAHAAVVTEFDELARLGNDLEVLRRLAVRGKGETINIVSNDIDEKIWPALPGGQIRARSTRMIPLAPPLLTALAIASLLAIVWALRKRLRLD